MFSVAQAHRLDRKLQRRIICLQDNKMLVE